jgi:hypothetical protein
VQRDIGYIQAIVILRGFHDKDKQTVF